MMQESTEAPDLLSQPWSDPDRSSHSVNIALHPTITAISRHSCSCEHTGTINSKFECTATLVAVLESAGAQDDPDQDYWALQLVAHMCVECSQQQYIMHMILFCVSELYVVWTGI